MSVCVEHDRSVIECIAEGLACRNHGDPADADLIRYHPDREMPFVYVASPYTLGGVEANVVASIEAGEAIVATGKAIPVLPLLSHLWEVNRPHSYEFWIHYTMWLLSTCDMVVRLPGESKGADGEVAEAERLGLPVFFGLDDLLAELA